MIEHSNRIIDKKHQTSPNKVLPHPQHPTNPP